MALDLTCRLGDLELSTPLIAASGCFGYGTEYADLTPLTAFGAVVTKTITPQPRPGNTLPRIWETAHGGMLNSIGLANVGIDRYVVEKLPELRNYPSKVIVSVAGNTIAEYAALVAKMEPHSEWHALELNISCPNVKEGGISFGVNPKMTEEVVAACRKETKRHLIAKLTPMAVSLAEIAKACEAAGADSVSMVNTYVGMAIDTETRRPKIGTLTGGYSGPPIKPLAIARVWEVFRAVKIPLIGMGGIATAEDVVEFFLAGSSAVQIGTLIYADPAIPGKIVNGLNAYCERHGISSMKELTGQLQTDIPLIKQVKCD